MLIQNICIRYKLLQDCGKIIRGFSGNNFTRRHIGGLFQRFVSADRYPDESRRDS